MGLSNKFIFRDYFEVKKFQTHTNIGMFEVTICKCKCYDELMFRGIQVSVIHNGEEYFIKNIPSVTLPNKIETQVATSDEIAKPIKHNTTTYELKTFNYAMSKIFLMGRLQTMIALYEYKLKRRVET